METLQCGNDTEWVNLVIACIVMTYSYHCLVVLQFHGLDLANLDVAASGLVGELVSSTIEAEESRSQ